MRRVAWRLAALTTGSLVALVVAMLAIVYFTTQSAMQQSLHDTLTARATAVLPTLLEYTKKGDSENENDKLQETVSSELTSGGVLITTANTRLQVTGGSSKIFAGKLPDIAAARKVLSTRKPEWSTHTVPGNERYLLYTVPLQEDNRAMGVAQLAISLRQYDQSVADVLRELLLVSALGILASAAITLVVVNRAMFPIRRSMRRQRDFVSDAAHELRTPVAILRTASELGLESGNVTEQQSALEQAMAESVHLARLVDDLSLLAHADSGVLSLDRQSIDLARLAREAVQGVDLLAEERGVHMTVEAPQSLQFFGDWDRIRQLLLILLDNALKHTPDGGTIVVRLDRHGNRLVMQVQDSGAGIDPSDIPHLFDRFYRGTRDRGIEGGGLGLAIGQWIAQAHGGQIKAGNVTPHGAIFTVTLPSP
jgi:signal transduction histidine kinase